jgi:hypothetical protein
MGRSRRFWHVRAVSAPGSFSEAVVRSAHFRFDADSGHCIAFSAGPKSTGREHDRRSMNDKPGPRRAPYRSRKARINWSFSGLTR